MSDERERGDEQVLDEDTLDEAIKAFQAEQDRFNTACWDFDERVNAWILAKYEARK